MFSTVGQEAIHPEPLRFRLRRGLDLPISGDPRQTVRNAAAVSSVALCGRDFIGLRPKLLVRKGERVSLGAPLFAERRDPRILFTSPGCGVVSAIHQGPRRTLRSVVIDLEGSEEVGFPRHPEPGLADLNREGVRETLLSSGLWTVLRTRPFGRIPASSSSPRAIFVTAIDSNPLAADPRAVIGERRSEFLAGLKIVSRLTEGPVYLCQGPDADDSYPEVDRLKVAVFEGPHPAGLAGTHIHFLDPVGLGKTVWYLNYQDAIRVGMLFMTGRYPADIVVSLGGPCVKHPGLLRTRVGCDLHELLAGELEPGPKRLISGSVLSGRAISRQERYLGCRHFQISVIPEALDPPASRQQTYSVHSWLPFGLGGKRRMTTASHGEPSSLVPLGAFQRVMPLDILATPLLRALAVGDSERAEALGCLELEEEDLALCTFVCPGKLEYGSLLRRALDRIEKEG